MNGIFNALIALAPISFLTLAALVVVVVEAAAERGERFSFWIALIGLAGAGAASICSVSNNGVLFDGMISAGGLGKYFALLFSVVAFMVVVLSRSYLERQKILHGEYYALILFATIGMMLMAAAADLVILFLGIEVMSISLYVLAGFMRRNIQSNEAAMKYFLLGAFATGFLLYGIALMYGAARTTNITNIVMMLPVLSMSFLFWTGVGLFIVGLSFKIAAVPFHMWVPDVYEGAPTTVTAFMSTAAKGAAFAAVIVAFGAIQDTRISTSFAVLAAASMIVGNVVAISQTSVKRMLAYSSIAHAGYILAGVAACNSFGKEGVIYYVSVYAFMNIGAFGVLSLIEGQEGKNLTYEDSAGLAQKKPLLAAIMAIFMFSLTGIPPFVGFFAKYYVFAAAVGSGLTWLAVVGVLTSLFSAYYYLRLVVVMYFREAGDASWEKTPRFALSVVVAAAVATVVFGFVPSLVLSMMHLFV